MNEVIREFLLESHENLAQLDADLIALEKEPGEKQTLARVFRNLHTVKGSAGFLGLGKLQAVAHSAENLLSKLRSGELSLTPEMTTALLQTIDAIRHVLAALETQGTEGSGDYTALVRSLDQLRETPGVVPEASARAALTQPVASVKEKPDEPLARTLIAPELAAPAKPDSSTTIGQEAAEPRVSAVSDSSIRVDVGLLDKLMNLVGELVLARNQIVQYSSSQEDDRFIGTVQRLNQLTTELQAGVMKTRMQPIGNLWSKFPRVVRDLAVACGKQARIEMEGQETELDKSIVEAIRDPLTHIIRNAVDHGLETPAKRTERRKPAEGRVTLRAFHEGGKVIIEIADDGGGIDPIRVRDKALRTNLISPQDAARMSERELVNLVFLPGFSTTDQVSQFSGRGVGMDVVRTNIERIGGSVDLESRVGQGTAVRMKIPLTLAIIPALIVHSGGERFAIPQVSLLELLRVEADQMESIHGAPVYRLRGNLLPLVDLNRELQIGDLDRSGALYIVVLHADDRQFGLIVDGVRDTEEIVVKPLQKQLKSIGVFAGATIMGDGRVALILDVLGLATRARVVAGGRARAAGDSVVRAAETPGAVRQSLLVFAAGGGRMAIPLSRVARLEEFPRSSIERAGTRKLVQYRGEILPLIDVGRIMREAKFVGKSKRPPSENVPIVVVSEGDRQFGLIVQRIVDIVEEEVATTSPSSRPGVIRNAVIQGRVTELLDVSSVIGIAEAERSVS